MSGTDLSALDVDFRLSLDQFDLAVRLQAGPERIVVFGPSGAGKSLTMRTLAGLVAPDAGVIRVAGRTWFDSDRQINQPPQARRVGYVPQNYGLFPHLSVAGNVAFGLHRLPRQQRAQRVIRILQVMHLAEQADMRPGELSGGQQQRVALARALVTEPDLLLMDEPLGALDATLRERLRQELRQVQARFGIPTLLITHDLAEAYSLAERLVILDRGQVVQSGRRDEVFRRPASPEVARVLGMSNILRGRVLGWEPGALQVDWAGYPLYLASKQVDGRSPGQEVTFGIRPEEVMFVRQNQPLRPRIGENLVPGTIVADDAQGFDHHLSVAVEGKDGLSSVLLSVRLPHPVYLRLELAVGQQHQLALKADAFHVFA